MAGGWKPDAAAAAGGRRADRGGRRSFGGLDGGPPRSLARRTLVDAAARGAGAVPDAAASVPDAVRTYGARGRRGPRGRTDNYSGGWQPGAPSPGLDAPAGRATRLASGAGRPAGGAGAAPTPTMPKIHGARPPRPPSHAHGPRGGGPGGGARRGAGLHPPLAGAPLGVGCRRGCPRRGVEIPPPGCGCPRRAAAAQAWSVGGTPSSCKQPAPAGQSSRRPSRGESAWWPLRRHSASAAATQRVALWCLSRCKYVQLPSVRRSELLKDDAHWSLTRIFAEQAPLMVSNLHHGGRRPRPSPTPNGRHTMQKPGFCLKYENATKREEFWAELFLEGATYYNAWI